MEDQHLVVQRQRQSRRLAADHQAEHQVERGKQQPEHIPERDREDGAARARSHRPRATRNQGSLLPGCLRLVLGHCVSLKRRWYRPSRLRRCEARGRRGAAFQAGRPLAHRSCGYVGSSPRMSRQDPLSGQPWRNWKRCSGWFHRRVTSTRCPIAIWEPQAVSCCVQNATPLNGKEEDSHWRRSSTELGRSLAPFECSIA